jgi:hypothetical protein
MLFTFLAVPSASSGFGILTNNPADNILPKGHQPATECITSGFDSFNTFSGPWWENGSAAFSKLFAKFGAAYKRAGGVLDIVVADMEAPALGMITAGVPDGTCFGSTNATKTCLSCNEMKWRAIQQDKRWPAALSDLKKKGFVVDESKPDYLVDAMMKYVCSPTNQRCLVEQFGKNQTNKHVWNAWAFARASAYWNASIATPITASFPEAKLSMYNTYRWSSQHCTTPSNEGRMSCSESTTGGASGLSQTAPVYYEDWPMWDCLNPPPAGSPMARYVAGCKDYPSVSVALKESGQVSDFKFTYYSTFKLVVNQQRQNVLGSPKGSVSSPWISWKSLSYGGIGGTRVACRSSHFWQEKLLHIALMGANNFQYFAVSGITGCVYGMMCRKPDYDIMASVLLELDEVVGSRPRQWLADTNPRWRDSFVLTGTQFADSTELLPSQHTPMVSKTARQQIASQSSRAMAG